MQNKIPPRSVPSQSANDNGPLSPGQVKALKLAIAIMGVLIVASLLAIVGRVIYLSAIKPRPPVQVSTGTTEPLMPAAIAPTQTLVLPKGAVIRNMTMQNGRLLVHFETPAGPGAILHDMSSDKTISRFNITTTGK